MQKSTAVTVAILVMALLAQFGCSSTRSNTEALPQVDPLQVRRANGVVQDIRIADAMAYHHRHEDHADTPSSDEQDHEHELCIGVVSGYQAIRFAGARLFPNGTPDASDIELSARGGMPGVWDVFELYTGREMVRPARQVGTPSISPASFTFEAKQISTDQSISFRLREGLIPARFYELKAQGMGCDVPEVNEVKSRAARLILNTPPTDCFDLLPLEK
ncbi:MAG: hypothetical protein EHM48_10110 [Planctomycetaceae bacterium]|nr:MAG: hypothetical protein EHM48_10110 [Planctomycetaceae bacterium]